MRSVSCPRGQLSLITRRQAARMTTLARIVPNSIGPVPFSCPRPRGVKEDEEEDRDEKNKMFSDFLGSESSRLHPGQIHPPSRDKGRPTTSSLVLFVQIASDLDGIAAFRAANRPSHQTCFRSKSCATRTGYGNMTFRRSYSWIRSRIMATLFFCRSTFDFLDKRVKELVLVQFVLL